MAQATNNHDMYALHEDDDVRKRRLSGQSDMCHSLSVHLLGENDSTIASKKGVTMPLNTTATSRIMDRDDKHFKRSKGRWNIRRVKMPKYWKLYMQDPFHTLVHVRASKVLALLMLLYIVVLMTFGALYTTVPQEECKTAIMSYFDGFSFSVSVLFTIGFGTNGGDVFFNECGWMQTLITVESLVGVILDALAIGIIFQRFARAQARANTIVLSHNACVRRIRGELYFMFQVCEMRKHQLVEAHVRMYAVRHDVDFGKCFYFQSYPMRIQHPNDELNGMLLLALPSVVVHRIDEWSPLMRPRPREATCPLHHNPATHYLFPEPMGRRADMENGDRDGLVAVDIDRRQPYCRCMCNSASNNAPAPATPMTHREIVEDTLNYWRESQLEVIVLIEGIDAVTSATIQVRHSYKAEEILFDHRFENCVDVDPETGGAVIDFNRFHATTPVDAECVQVAGAYY
ncbi:TPA: hypothetical protein N0F65_002211 [Lagenidium giganteum]|uniref:Uncharacterized protein n=1 Tax=Lagenidium giganteum TaxID=4803 RepID=A0AAV2YSC6_9STRA|nr:TPA: hypothetical protein N0F65_002211 [Lagenidium giganteum]